MLGLRQSWHSSRAFGPRGHPSYTRPTNPHRPPPVEQWGPPPREPSVQKREFTVANEYTYNRSGPVRWIISHILRYPWIPFLAIVLSTGTSVLASATAVLIGRSFDLVLSPNMTAGLLVGTAMTILAVGGGRALVELVRMLVVEVLAQLMERDTRDELYTSLLGKSLTFHGRQRVGDIMARATGDVHQLNILISPGFGQIFSSLLGLIVPLATIVLTLRWDLTAVPLVFILFLVVTLRLYMVQLEPVVGKFRQAFGLMSARLEETISGIEVVKGNAQEVQEEGIFYKNMRTTRDYFVRQGVIQARYLPLLVFALALGMAFMQALFLLQRGVLTVGQVVAYMGLIYQFGFPAQSSLWTFATIQLGVASARRLLDLITAETELDENPHGVSQPLRGEIVFENVSFGYDGAQVLRNISFRAQPGETIAIVGQTGSGKTTLTRLVNRTYDPLEGRVLIDGVDTRKWNLDSLRSQISAIEQDIFLFSRSLADNIAFGKPEASPAEVEAAAGSAQADEFIREFDKGYETVIGERGVTLSGGQRQRLAIARAFLTDPRILILDDSTSAIDSATEDRIQRAIAAAAKGRTTLIITHRLSQIRWADLIVVLRQGRIAAIGSHEELMESSEAYSRIFRE
jgi:ATP-binding cassette, subfamily B, bacterial